MAKEWTRYAEYAVGDIWTSVEAPTFAHIALPQFAWIVLIVAGMMITGVDLMDDIPFNILQNSHVYPDDELIMLWPTRAYGIGLVHTEYGYGFDWCIAYCMC